MLRGAPRSARSRPSHRLCRGAFRSCNFTACPAMNLALAKRHILFVDDEAPIRELLALFFRKKGMEVTTAMNIEQAKELAAAVPFDLAIVDVNLAGQNGLELL